jgi:hypothetical protein
MKKVMPLVVAALFVAVGCVPSLHPLYAEKDLAFDPALVGVWEAKDAGRWDFQAADGKEYRLIYTDDNGKPGKFIAHLVKLDQRLFLDLYPQEPDSNGNAFYWGHLVPAHTFMKVLGIDPKLQLAVMDADWLKKYLKENPKAVAHEVLEDGDRVVLTASTPELQKFVLQHADDEQLWKNVAPMERKPAEEAPPAGASPAPGSK